MFYNTNMVNLAEKFKLSPKFFLISRKVTFFSGYSHYFMDKKLRNCLLFNFGAIWNIRPKNSKKTGAKTFTKKVHTPANEFQTHQDFNILYYSDMLGMRYFFFVFFSGWSSTMSECKSSGRRRL